jgi:hypothetical protein
MEKLQFKTTDKEWFLVLKIQEAEEQNLSSDATKKELLQTIYKDKGWSEFYDEQTSKFANYKTSISHYAFWGDVSLDDVKQSFRQRLNLSQEEIDWFLNPDNIVSSPENLKRKSITSYPLEQGDLTCQDVMEDGEVIQRFLLGKDGKKITEEYFADESKFVKVFDQDESVCCTYYTRTDKEGNHWKHIPHSKSELLSIKTNADGEILSVSLRDRGEEQLSPQQSKELMEQYDFVYDTFNKIKDGKGDDDDIAFAYMLIKEDKLGLYNDNPVLLKTINDEAVKKGVDKKYCSDCMQKDGELAQKIYNSIGQHRDVDSLQAQASITPISLYNYKNSKEQTI